MFNETKCRYKIYMNDKNKRIEIPPDESEYCMLNYAIKNNLYL